MEPVSKIKTEESPCEYKNGCAMAGQCKALQQVCSQYTSWANNGYIDFSKSRVPKPERRGIGTAKATVTDINHMKKRGARSPKAKDLLKRQQQHRHTLCQLSNAELIELAPIIGYATGSLRQMRSSGLSEMFLDCMESEQVKAFLKSKNISTGEAA